MNYDEKALSMCVDQDPDHHFGRPCSLCRHLAQALREAAAEATKTERAWADSLWYGALKWGGIGGLMRAKLLIKVTDTRSKVQAVGSNNVD